MILGSSGGQGPRFYGQVEGKAMILGSGGGQGPGSRVKWSARPWF